MRGKTPSVQEILDTRTPHEMHIMRMRSRSSASTHVAKREYNLFSEYNEDYSNQFGNLLELEACRVKPDRF